MRFSFGRLAMRALPLAWLPLVAVAGEVAAPSRAFATAIETRYRVHAGGVTVLEIDARIELNAAGYRLRTLLRTRGIAELMVPGEQVTESRGSLRGAEPLPALYRADGIWRGRTRRIEIEFRGAEPVLRVQIPPEAVEREPVPPELRRGTLDALSALVKLARIVADTGRCEGEAAVFDGRRRTDYVLSTSGWDTLPRWRDAWSGEALRCGFEGRQVAGFHRDQDPAERGRPQHGIAWVASVVPGGPPVPVRVELATRWLGTIQAYLVTAAAVR